MIKWMDPNIMYNMLKKKKKKQIPHHFTYMQNPKKKKKKVEFTEAGRRMLVLPGTEEGELQPPGPERDLVLPGDATGSRNSGQTEARL